MKSHGMEFVGKLFIQQVPTLPTWTSDDIARVIFVEDEYLVYVGNPDGNWVPIGHYFRDLGTGTDPESGNPFANRAYDLKATNGNLHMEYEE